MKENSLMRETTRAIGINVRMAKLRRIGTAPGFVPEARRTGMEKIPMMATRKKNAIHSRRNVEVKFLERARRVVG